MTPRGFQIPVLSEVVERPRLREILASGDHCRIILVTGQAAQGKSTVVADFLLGEKTESLWFHLSARASDNNLLFEILSRGLDQVTACPDASMSPPHITLGTRQDLLRQAEILVARLNRAKTPLNLVLDDMEALEDGCSALELIQHLLKESPGTVRFFLLSRRQPQLSLSRFKMQKDLLEITNQDLAFTLAETRAFFKASGPKGQSGLKPGEAKQIQAITNGWAGGLVLVSESVRRSQGLKTLPDHLTAEAFSYFSQEIWEFLSGKIRTFLTTTALFEELDTRILSLFFESREPLDILARLEERNLFIRKTRPGNQWPVYRYNNLFREFLQADLAGSLDEPEILALHRRIGEVYWQEKDHEKAIPFFFSARDFEKIARILRIKGADYVITGRVNRLARWIRALPDQVTADDPWLVFFGTMAGRIQGGKKNIKAFGRTLDAFTQEGDTRGILLSLAYLIEASVFIRQPSQVLLKWIRAGEEALAGLGGQYRFTRARTLLWQQIGLGYIAGTGDIPKGISACRNAILLAQGIESRDLALNASVILTLGLVQSGDFSGARKMLDKTRTIAQEDRHPEYRALENITNIDLALKRGDTGRAGELLTTSEADIEKFGLIFLYPGFVEARAVYYAATGQYDLAVQAADHLSDFSVLEGNDFYLGISHRLKAMVALLRGEVSGCVDEAQKAARELGRSRRGDLHLFLARQILGQGLFLLGNADPAKAELEAAAGYFCRIGSDLSFCETVFVLGLLAEREEAAQYFEAGLEKAAENRYRHFPLLGNELLAKVFVRACICLKDPEDRLIPYVMNFDDPALLSLIRSGVTERMAGMDKKEKAGAESRCFSLFRAACPKLFITTLGPFSLCLGTSPVSDLPGGKPLLLMKNLILNGARDVAKEILVDAIWPDATTAAGEKNLKINLHRLRKTLEPFSGKGFGHVYLIQKGGRVSLDPDLVRIDTRVFEDHCRQGRGHEEREAWEAALDAYDRAARLYRGDYFQDDPYLDAMGNKREVLRRNCIDMLSRKAAIHEDLYQWQAAVAVWHRVLEIDSCHEEAYQNLMILYGDAGLETEAAQVFARCEAKLREELDTVPGRQTLEIFHRVVRQPPA